MARRTESNSRIDPDTNIGGSRGRFPLTRHSLIAATRSSDPELRRRAYDSLVSAYWKPVYKYVRIKWKRSNEDAKDLTQGFFLTAIEKGFFDRYDPDIARFRTFLRTCLDRYVANERKAASRLKRGGGAEVLSLDFAAAEAELVRGDAASPKADMEEFFQREWIRNLFALAIEDLKDTLESCGKGLHFELFRRYDLERPELDVPLTYQRLAEEHDLPVTQVNNYLALARRELRRIVLERLRAISGSEEEFRQEAREFLGFAAE